MFRTYDDWKLATPPEYEEGEKCSEGNWCDRTCCCCTCPCHEIEEPPKSMVCIELDDRNDPPML